MCFGFRLQCIWKINAPYAALQALSEGSFGFGLVGSGASGGYRANCMMELQNRSVGGKIGTCVKVLREFQLTEGEPHGGGVGPRSEKRSQCRRSGSTSFRV